MIVFELAQVVILVIIMFCSCI